MRAMFVFSVALLMAQAASAQESGCDSYRTNKSGGDPACDAAIAREVDPQTKSDLLFKRAYMEDAADDFATYPKALADLDEAIRLWPQSFSALAERGYLYNEYERWKDAQADLDAAIRLDPSYAHAYRERAIARFGLGDLQGEVEDLAALVMLEPDEPGNFVSRATALMWLGRFDEARKDLDAADALAAKTGSKDSTDRAAKARTRLTLWTRTSGGDPARACLDAKTEEAFRKPTFVGDCTRAFLDARTPKQKADALTQRSMILPEIEQSPTASLPDLRLAYALDPANPEHAFNLGSILIQTGWVELGLPYVEESLKAEVTYYGLAARAIAKFQLGDLKGAFEDGKKSFELKPNDIALTVLGDTVHAKTKSYDQAKTYWIAAYHMGDRDDGLIERLKKAGVPIPPPDDAAATKSQ